MVNIVTPEGSPEGSPIMSAMDYFYANQNHHDDDDYTTSENEMQLDDHVLDEFDYYFTHNYEHEQFNYFMDMPTMEPTMPIPDNIEPIMPIPDNIEPIMPIPDYNNNNNYNNTNIVNVIEYNNDEIDDNDNDEDDEYDDEYIPLAPPPLVRQVNVISDDFRYYNQLVDNNGQSISQQ